MGWSEKYKEDKRAKLTINVTAETKELFKEYAKNEGSNPVQIIREMCLHLINEYDDEVGAIQ